MKKLTFFEIELQGMVKVFLVEEYLNNYLREFDD